MLNCSIKGCEECCSEVMNPQQAARWIILRACQCGAYDQRNAKECTCPRHPEHPTPITYWPRLDWWMAGGVDELTLCPAHRREVTREITLQRLRDPSMNPGGGLNPTNRH